MLIDFVRFASPAVAAGALVAAALHDLRSYQIPNRFAAAIALAFLVASLGGSLREAISGLALAVVVLAGGIVLFARHWLGGGDVKLLAATALWVPAPLVAGFALVTSLAGAVLAIALLTPLRRQLPTPPTELVAGTAGALRQPMPFGVAIAVGGLFVLCTRVTG